MDPRELHNLVGEVVRYSRSASPPVQQFRKQRVVSYDISKRYATYFPSKASFDTKWDFSNDDDTSTWEFSAPVAPRSSSSSSSSSTGTGCSSPAQAIAIRYRTGIPFDFVETRSDSVSESEESDVTWETAPFDDISISSNYAPIIPEKAIKAVYRKSRFDALEETRQEAMAVMKQDEKTESDSLVCRRPGCRDTVRDVRALMYHLHIHNIHDESLLHAMCENTHKHSQYLASRHSLTNNQTRAKSPPSSPLKECFSRVFGKIVHRT